MQAETTITGPDPIAAEVDSKWACVRKLADLSEADYRGRAEWSVSAFKLLPEEPELFYGRHILKLPDYQMAPSPAMQMGTALHECLLQGIAPKIIPADVLSSSGAKQGNAWRAFAKEHAGEIWLKEAEGEPIKAAVKSVYENAAARKILETAGDCELAIFWRDEYTGIPLRGRLDKLLPTGAGIVIDIKTANDAGLPGFPFACLDRKYHVQAAAYSAAVEAVTGDVPEGFVFLVIEVAPPYVCQVYNCRPEMLRLGLTKMRESLSDLKARIDTNDWHRAGHGHLNLLDLPEKAYK